MTARRPRVAVLVFPGSNDDGDAVFALEALGAEAVPVWHRDSELPAAEAVVLPGGFSYGDYLRCGAIARFSPVMGPVREFAASGGPVLGICNGFQVLCEAGLLPGILRPNESLRFHCADVRVVVEHAAAPFTSRLRIGEQLTIPVKHAEGAFFAPADLLSRLERHRQIVLRYAPDHNPNGSIANIAGVRSAEGNVMGLMPHPEHAVEPLLGSSDGAGVLGSLVDAARQRLPLTAS